jgi:hypothetical protein
MKIRIIPVAAGLAGATALAITGATLASAASGTATRSATVAVAASSGTATATPQPPRGNGNTDPSKPMRSDEQLLTGTTAQKVTAAAKAKEPSATIQRVETDSDGVYEAHMVRSDGTHVTVQVDASFTVTAVQEGGPGGAGGPGGPGGDHDGDGPQGQSGQQGEAPASPNGTATPSSTT